MSKNWNNIDFCKDPKGCIDTSAISELISNSVFFGDIKEVILERYEKMQANYAQPVDVSYWHQGQLKCIVGKRKDMLLEVPRTCFQDLRNTNFLKGKTNIGHDLPIWICKKEKEIKNRIMMIYRDPLRSNCKKETLYLSTPFGFHSAQFRGNKTWTQVIESLMNSGNLLYLTDYYKLYYDKPVGYKWKNDVKMDGIIKKEIELFKPDIIMRFGKDVQDNCNINLPKGSTAILKDIQHPNCRISKANFQQASVSNKVEYFIMKMP